MQGFLKATGLASLDQAEKRDTGKGEFWFAVIAKKGGPTAEALPGIIDAAMKALPWPKSMKWGSGTMTWVRPLQSILALFDGKVLAGEVAPGGAMAPIRFGDTTRGHRFLSKGAIKVTDFADYAAKLRAAHVVLDPAERKKIVLAGAEKLCADAQVALRPDDGLLDEVAGLVEWPVPMLGTIDGQFMDVPPEVLIVSMRTHQRYFVTNRKDGALANRFVVVANNVARDGGKTIVAGNERVLRARLSDAKFFWDQDRKMRLEERLPALKDIVFHAKLGTLADRVDAHRDPGRELAPYVAGADCRPGDPGGAPLQGRPASPAWSASSPSCRASWAATTRWTRSCRPPSPTPSAIIMRRPVPTTAARARRSRVAVALADKLDTLVGFFAIGEKPTGSRIPSRCAARRSASSASSSRTGLRPAASKQVLRRRPT